MTIFLRQSTASQEVLLGPFLDDTDGKTAETALTIANTDIKIWKNGGTTEASKNSGGATHIASGRYYAVLDATDTDTLGPLVINVHVSGALPVRLECCVLAANVYDSLIGASDKLQVHADEITDGLITASAIATGAIDADAIAADAVTEIQSGLATSAALATVDSKVDAILVDTGTDIPATLSTIAGYIDTEVASILTAVDTEVAAIKAVTDNLPDSGALTSLATAADLATVDGVVDAIKAKTDSLTFTTAGRVDASARDVNGSTAAAARLERAAASEVLGTVGNGSTTTSIVASALSPASAVNDQFNGRIIIFAADTTTTALRGQATNITDYDHASTTFTVTALTTAPSSGDTFVVV